jgi:ubiquinone/menaquinone biosynthesis C-methylase UbiE
MLYDDQAAAFDERAGLHPDTADAVARALVSLANPAPGARWLEIGVGTGSLSIPLLSLPIHYIGFDRSAAMLERFRERADAAGLGAELVTADGNERWPAEDHGIDLIFSARALHHLDPDHVVAETRRVLAERGGWLVVGRVRRGHDSVKEQVRRHMRHLLEDEGYPGRSHQRGVERIFAALETEGGRRLPPISAARWTMPHAPADSIAAWEGKEGLAGVDVPPPIKERVLAETRRWAQATFGAIERPIEQEETFELQAIDLRAA